MNNLSVELRVDIGGADGIPHSFLVVTGPGGIEQGYGFAPLEHGQLTGNGWIYDDTNHEYSVSTGKTPLDVGSYNRLIEYIGQSIDNPPPYYLPYGYQGADWALKGLVEARISAIAPPRFI